MTEISLAHISLSSGFMFAFGIFLFGITVIFAIPVVVSLLYFGRDWLKSIFKRRKK